MPNNLAAFAIHVEDVQRARRFYEAVFGWKFEPWGPPDFYLIHTGDETHPGVQGLMHKRQQPRGQGGPNCFECTIGVDDVDAIATAVKKHGGKITMEKSKIPTVGEVIYLEDPEGNRVGAMKYDMPVHT
ncbi:MAG: VOC family protein [Alphaproteobacteria bacterium]|nr:VOC family protein [Alphaproteobacteria bacterium]